MTLIRLARRKPGISAGLMRRRGSEKNLTLMQTLNFIEIISPIF